MKEPVGYCFFPSIPENFKLRYTPMAISITGPTCTKDAVLKSERKLAYSNEYVDLIWLSCGAEIVTDLGSRLGVYLLGEE
jgi:hypothetical protein